MGLIMDRYLAEALLRLTAPADGDPPTEWDTATIPPGVADDDPQWGGPNPLD